MKSNNNGFVEVVVIVAIAVIIGMISIFATKKDDSHIEEIAESVIEQQLGLPPGIIDLTPDSKEP